MHKETKKGMLFLISIHFQHHIFETVFQGVGEGVA